MIFMWASAERDLPAEREWVVGSYDIDRGVGFRVEIVRRIGELWFDWLGRTTDEPKYWTHRPR
jgi:hypothetical protein